MCGDVGSFCAAQIPSGISSTRVFVGYEASAAGNFYIHVFNVLGYLDARMSKANWYNEISQHVSSLTDLCLCRNGL
jgi:hypothetical protein